MGILLQIFEVVISCASKLYENNLDSPNRDLT